MPNLYASRAEFRAYQAANWPDAEQLDDATLDRLLIRASRLLDQLTIAAVYSVDSAEMPTEADIVEAFRDFVCEQAHYWDSEGDDLTETFTGGSLGGLSLPASGARGQMRVSPDAIAILEAALDLRFVNS